MNYENGEMVWHSPCIFNPESHDVPYAMVVLNQPLYIEPDFVKRLWVNACFKATVDGGTNRWLEFIRKNSGTDLTLPDLISGDFDSITSETEHYFREKNVKFVPTPDQDETDFTKGLREVKKSLIQKNLKVVFVLAMVTNSGRLDHIMGNLETLHTAGTFLGQIPLVLMSDNSVTWLLNPGNHEIKVPDDFVNNSHSVGLIPLKGPTRVTTSGLKWDLVDGRLAFGELVSTSNTFLRNSVKIACDQDLIWTMQFSLNET